MTVPPEIKRLRGQTLWAGMVAAADAEQAVRDAEARVRGRAENGTWPDQSAQHAVLLDQIKDARREAFREAVEALRALAARHHRRSLASYAVREAADLLEQRFLTSEGEDDGR